MRCFSNVFGIEFAQNICDEFWQNRKRHSLLDFDEIKSPGLGLATGKPFAFRHLTRIQADLLITT